MKTVTKRELNQQTAQVLAGVTEGDTVVVTERGVARWRIEAVGADSDPVARLRAQGKLTPPKANPMPWTTDDPHDDPEGVDRIYAEMRADGR